MSSVTVSVAIPPIASMASRRKTALVPQQKAQFQASLEARVSSYHSPLVVLHDV